MWNKSLPLYKMVANRIKEDIIYSSFSEGDMIPSEAKLAEMYQVSRVTVRRAIKLLIEENLLYSVQGSGTFIEKEKMEYDIFKLQSFTSEMIEKNTEFFNEILEFKLITPSSHIQDILELSNEEKVFFVKRLRYVNDEPYILEETHLPVKLFPELSVDIMKQSFYEHIKNKGCEISNRQGELEPIMPSKDLIQLFQLDNGVPILLMKHHSAFKNNIMFEYTKIYFHPYRYTFKFKYPTMK